jgi:hypothetical protein
MIGQILPNNNEKCYSNFSPTFREVNAPRGSAEGLWQGEAILRRRQRRVRGRRARWPTWVGARK